MLASHCLEWAEKMDGQIGLRPRTATTPSSSRIRPNGQNHTIYFIVLLEPPSISGLHSPFPIPNRPVDPPPSLNLDAPAPMLEYGAARTLQGQRAGAPIPLHRLRQVDRTISSGKDHLQISLQSPQNSPSCWFPTRTSGRLLNRHREMRSPTKGATGPRFTTRQRFEDRSPSRFSRSAQPGQA